MTCVVHMVCDERSLIPISVYAGLSFKWLLVLEFEKIFLGLSVFFYRKYILEIMLS